MTWKHSTMMTHKHSRNKTQPHQLHLLFETTVKKKHKRFQCPPPLEFKFRRALFPPPSTTSVTDQTTPYQPTASRTTVSASNPSEYQCLLFLLLSLSKLLSKLLSPHPTSLETVKKLTLFIFFSYFQCVKFLFCLNCWKLK
jgi:hypothetical protein